MDMTEIKKALDETFKDIKDGQQKTADEIKGELSDLKTNVEKSGNRLTDVEQKLALMAESTTRKGEIVTFGQMFTESEQFKSLVASGTMRSARVTFGEAESRKAVAPIYESIDPNLFPVYPDRRPGIIAPAQRKVWVRPTLPSGQTGSNLIEYVQEVTPDGMAPAVVPEGAQKPQSDLHFKLVQAPVVTIAHFIMASRQVLADVAMLQSYINMRMSYGLQVKTDDELLNGDGTAGHLHGLIAQATPFVPAAGSTPIDNIRIAMANIEVNSYTPDVVYLNPADWATIQMSKSSTGEYLYGDPASPATPPLWGLPVVVTNAIPQGYFLVGDRSQSMVWNRQETSIEVSREDRDNFIKNMVTILVEERLGFSVYAPLAWQYGPLTGGAGGAASKAAK